MIESLKRLCRKKTWVKFISKSGREYIGQIRTIKEKYIILDFASIRAGKKRNMSIALKKSEIESIECLTCENSEVWTN